MTRITWILLALGALLAGCQLLDPYNMIGRQLGEATPLPTEFVPDAGARGLDRAARIRAFDAVWGTIESRYHDPAYNGVDWKAVGERYQPLALAAPTDDAFWDVLDRMTGELHDSHTRVESPKQVQLRERDEAITLGFVFLPVAGHLAVTSVDPDSDAWWGGVRPGMLVAAIGGEPAQAAYDKLLAETRSASTARARHFNVIRKVINGPEGSKVAFAFERADGSRFDITLARRIVPRRHREIHRVLPSGYGYLRFTQWTIGLTTRAIGGLEQLRKTPGLVIDLRGNPGGSVYAVNSMLEKFFTRPTQLGRATTRSGHAVSLLMGTVDIIKLERDVPGDPDAYRGPVVILVDGLSASGSELFAGTMQATGRAEVVGEPSCGCLLGFLGYARIPGGGALAYSEVGFVLSNGRHVEGEGVIPDRIVPHTLEDLRVSRDRPLEAAQAMLAAMKPAGAAPGAQATSAREPAR
jgi:carboxyl-terminal processing protease